MSDTITEAAPAAEVTPAAPVETPAQEIDWKAEARKWEGRAKDSNSEAKANADAAKRLAEIEDAAKTAEQKSAERLEAAEQRANRLEAEATRAKVANAHGVPDDILAGPASSSADDLAEFAAKLIAFKGTAPNGPYVPAEGKTPALALNGDGIESALRRKLGI